MNFSALIGNPVDHSVSNELFLLIAKEANIEYSHIKILVPHKKDLKKTIDSLSYLGFSGINITLPYKIDAIRYLNDADTSVQESGAVNTIKFKNGKYLGYNTDCFGFTETCNNLLKPIEKHDNVFVFGTGGAARAILQQITKKTNNIYVFGRNDNNIKNLKKHFGNKIKEYNDYINDVILQKISSINPEYYINATPLGMIPNQNSLPIPASAYKTIPSSAYFLDAVFNPYKTLFLKKAEKIGAKVAPGIYWMIYQGIVAFNIWNDTKVELSPKQIENIAKKLIRKLQK